MIDAQLVVAREWVADCIWLEDPEYLQALSDLEIKKGIDRHYSGGWLQFCRDNPQIQIFQFNAIEHYELNGNECSKRWLSSYGSGTEMDARDYTDLLNQKIPHPNTPNGIWWTFELIDYDPREEIDGMNPEHRSHVSVLAEEINFYWRTRHTKLSPTAPTCPYFKKTQEWILEDIGESLEEYH